MLQLRRDQHSRNRRLDRQLGLLVLQLQQIALEHSLLFLRNPACRPIDQGALGNRLVALATGSSRFTQALQVLTSMEGYSVLTERAYLDFLHRDAESGALTADAAALTAGLTDFELNADIVASDEFFAKTVP